MVSRNAYILTTNKSSDRTLFSKSVLGNIGFNVILVQHIPHNDKVISNKITMQHIYKLIIDSGDDYAYVFEDDINTLETITLNEIIEYESISSMFFYLGACVYGNNIINTIDNTNKHNYFINNHRVYTMSGYVRGLHAIGFSKKGVEEFLEFSKTTDQRYMDVILEQFTLKYPANIVRYDLESYIPGHRGIIFQDRAKFPTTI
jgi:hypothetical protein